MKYYLEVWRKFAVFDGRARRSEYWYFVLFNYIVSIGIGILDFSMGTFDAETGYGLFGVIYSLAILIPSIAVTVRRMHDVGKSGWYMLIPIYNFILCLTEGDRGPNLYGPDPKDPNGGEMQIEDHLVDLNDV